MTVIMIIIVIRMVDLVGLDEVPGTQHVDVDDDDGVDDDGNDDDNHHHNVDLVCLDEVPGAQHVDVDDDGNDYHHHLGGPSSS